MAVDSVLSVIIGGFMCICGGFGTYGCYRCFVDNEGGRIHSEQSKSQQNVSVQGCCDNLIGGSDTKRKKLNTSRPLSSSDSSFNGTIYTVSSEGSVFNAERGENFEAQKMIENNHEIALSINPHLIGWTLNEDTHNNTNKKLPPRSKTAPL